MNYPLGEGLVVHGERGESWVRCARCSHAISRLEEGWRKRCDRRIFPPTTAGPLMGILAGRYVLEKIYCPACGALLESDMVKDDSSV